MEHSDATRPRKRNDPGSFKSKFPGGTLQPLPKGKEPVEDRGTSPLCMP